MTQTHSRISTQGAVGYEIMEIKKGTIYLVGAGPGNPGFLTVMAAEVLSKADVVMYDHVVSREILSLAKKAKLINAGLGGYANNEHQKKLADELVTFTSENSVVCRLKSGDPFLFGNGGETVGYIMQALKKLGRKLNLEIVPGISSGLGATASCGIPLTYTGIRKSVCILSGHEDTVGGHDYNALVKMGTLVLYMSLRTLETHVCGLINAGLPGTTPAWIIEKGCHLDQRTFKTNLHDLVEETQNEFIVEPVIFVIGKSVDFAIDLKSLK
jgi:uroporphyrin-III C-methyltransferase